MGPNKAKAEQITFYSHWLPALAPGEYSVTVEPKLKAAETLRTEPVTENFHVGGPRYALTGSEAYSCCPAPGQIGQFYDTLPHIVFDRCTLPWERTIDGTDPTVPNQAATGGNGIGSGGDGGNGATTADGANGGADGASLTDGGGGGGGGAGFIITTDPTPPNAPTSKVCPSFS